MRTPLIAGNWKMNKTVAESAEFVLAIRDQLNHIDGVDVALCPPAICIPTVAALVSGTKIGVGAQTMHEETSGAFTGELSPTMIAPYCQYVILGHSERRAYYAESDEGVNRKAKAALAHHLTPIICVGESLAQNEDGLTVSFTSGQVRAAFAGLSAEQAIQCVIAYEPIWAIGTGKSANPESAGGIIKSAVRDTLTALYGDETAQKIRIQYGGSVSPDNIASYMAHPDIDGALVGGASIKTGFIGLVQGAAQ